MLLLFRSLESTERGGRQGSSQNIRTHQKRWVGQVYPVTTEQFTGYRRHTVKTKGKKGLEEV